MSLEHSDRSASWNSSFIRSLQSRRSDKDTATEIFFITKYENNHLTMIQKNSELSETGMKLKYGRGILLMLHENSDYIKTFKNRMNRGEVKAKRSISRERTQIWKKLEIFWAVLFLILHRLLEGTSYNIIYRYVPVLHVFGERTYLGSYELANIRILTKLLFYILYLFRPVMLIFL